MDIRQSPLYADFMKKLGWRVEKVGKWNAFIKTFPIIGSFIKIQRISKPFPEKEIINLARKYHAFKVVIEPDVDSNFQFSIFNFQLESEVFSPSKTIHIDLTPTEKEIFNRFSPVKRRAVRRAEKNNIIVKESADIEDFIRLKSKQMFPLGFLLRKEIVSLWQAFSPNSIILLAYCLNDSNHLNKPLAGILLLFWQKTAYYWLASATNEVKKLSAPTLLVWEALKLAKKRGCTKFDFEGIYDPRFPKATKNWQGFTKFKKGFGGKEVEYPRSIQFLTCNLQTRNL